MKPEIEKWRVGPRSSAPPMYHTTSADGFNGMFRPVIAGRQLRIIASDGEGWQHVSVTIEGGNQPPPWAIMCAVKDLFWNDEDWVCQFHPAKSEYVNHHLGCLHLWKPVGREMPTPPSILVGPK